MGFLSGDIIAVLLYPAKWVKKKISSGVIWLIFMQTHKTLGLYFLCHTALLLKRYIAVRQLVFLQSFFKSCFSLLAHLNQRGSWVFNMHMCELRIYTNSIPKVDPSALSSYKICYTDLQNVFCEIYYSLIISLFPFLFLIIIS